MSKTPGHIKARETHIHRSIERRRALIEDIEFLLDMQEPGASIAQRLGYHSITSLDRQMYRLGRPDLGARIRCGSAAIDTNHNLKRTAS